MLVLALMVLAFASHVSDAAESGRVNSARLGYLRGAPRFAQFPARTNRKGERQYSSPGRCDQADGKAFNRLVRKQARANGPIFAGHYTIVICSCGMECGGVSIIDLQSGRIYDFGYISQVCDRALESYDDDIYFRVDSLLLILVGSPPNWKNGVERYKGCAIRYYRWAGRRLALLKEVPI